MAKTKIVNEIPDELEMEGEEVEVKTTEAEKAASEEQTGDVEIPKEAAKKEAKPVQEELDFDIEIEDDTPKNERAWKTAQDVALLVIYDKIKLDVTEGATHYHATYVRPSWAKTKKRTTRIEKLIFYRWEK